MAEVSACGRKSLEGICLQGCTLMDTHWQFSGRQRWVPWPDLATLTAQAGGSLTCAKQRTAAAPGGPRCGTHSVCVGRTRNGVTRAAHTCAKRLCAECGWAERCHVVPSHTPLMTMQCSRRETIEEQSRVEQWGGAGWQGPSRGVPPAPPTANV